MNTYSFLIAKNSLKYRVCMTRQRIKKKEKRQVPQFSAFLSPVGVQKTRCDMN